MLAVKAFPAKSCRKLFLFAECSLNACTSLAWMPCTDKSVRPSAICTCLSLTLTMAYVMWGVTHGKLFWRKLMKAMLAPTVAMCKVLLSPSLPLLFF